MVVPQKVILKNFGGGTIDVSPHIIACDEPFYILPDEECSGEWDLVSLVVSLVDFQAFHPAVSAQMNRQARPDIDVAVPLDARFSMEIDNWLLEDCYVTSANLMRDSTAHLFIQCETAFLGEPT